MDTRFQPPYLLPYAGSRPEHNPLSSISAYGCDKGQELGDDVVQYDFNKQGFRGPNFNPEADFQLLTIGCSNTFGTGIPWESTWSYILARMIESKKEVSVHLSNLSQGGASNDYIARTLLPQCAAVRPALVVVLFTFSLRKEWVGPQKVRSIGPWAKEDDEYAMRFYDNYTDKEGFINAIKNIILVKNFLAARNIPHILSWVEMHKLLDEEFTGCPICTGLIASLGKSALTSFHLRARPTWADFARDNIHPGPQSHKNFAERLFDSWKNLQD